MVTEAVTKETEEEPSLSLHKLELNNRTTEEAMLLCFGLDLLFSLYNEGFQSSLLMFMQKALHKRSQKQAWNSYATTSR